MNRFRLSPLPLAALLSLPAAAQTSPRPPLTLRRAAELALAHAPETASARAAAAESASRARGAAAGFSPQAFATTTPGYSSGLPVEVAGRVPSLLGFELHQTLYDPARRAEALEMQAGAEALAGISAATASRTIRDLVLSYSRNWEARSRIESSRRVLEAREAILRHVTALVREGRGTELEVEQAGLDVARAKQALADREAEHDLDRAELAWLIGFPRSETLEIAEDPLSALPEPDRRDSFAAARAADPMLLSLDRQAEALERAANLQRHAWLPVVQAEGQYLRLFDYNNFDQYFVKFKRDDWSIGVSVALPVWTSGRLGHGQAAAQSGLEKVRADRRTRERDLELAVLRAEADLARSQGESRLTTRALATARESLRVAQALTDEGRAEPGAVEQGQIAVAKAEDDLGETSQGLVAARAKLLELRGELPGALLASSTIAAK